MSASSEILGGATKACHEVHSHHVAAGTLPYLSDGPNDRIQAVIETGACRRLLSGSHAVQTAALKTVGNIVTGDDTQTQHVLDLSILSHIQTVIDQGTIFPRLVALLGLLWHLPCRAALMQMMHHQRDNDKRAPDGVQLMS